MAKGDDDGKQREQRQTTDGQHEHEQPAAGEEQQAPQSPAKVAATGAAGDAAVRRMAKRPRLYTDPLELNSDGMPVPSPTAAMEIKVAGDLAGATNERARQLASQQLAALRELTFIPDAGARHDFSDDNQTAIGQGDEIFRPGLDPGAVRAGRDVRRAFPMTPQGVVDAALYELHRGEARTLDTIKADPTAAKLQRGPAAPTEGSAGKNDDTAAPTVTAAQTKAGLGLRGTYATETKLKELAQEHTAEIERVIELRAKGKARNPEESAELHKLLANGEVAAFLATSANVVSQPVGHLQTAQQAKAGQPGEAVGGVRAASVIGTDSYNAKLAKQQPWCGSFVAEVYARCGIDVGKGFASNKKVPLQLSMMDGSTGYERVNTDSDKTGQKQHGKPRNLPYFADRTLSEIDHQKPVKLKDAEDVHHHIRTPTADAIDIRPGDVVWTAHDQTDGHVMLVIGVQHRANGVDIVTVEGNSDNKVQSKTHSIEFDPKTGAVTGSIVGWGRPPELGDFARPGDTTDPAMVDAMKPGAFEEGSTE